MTRLVKTKENINGLPIGFTEVEYLESTGTQYIDTGINAKSTLKTDIHFEVVDKTQGGHIFGGRTVTSGGRGYGVYLPTSGGIGFDYETRLSSNISTTNGYKYRVVKDGASNTLYVNGVQSYTGNNTAATFDLNVKIALFYMKDSNTSFNASVKCKVFCFKIWDNGTLVRDFIPALNPAGRPCMYDLVEKKAYYNLGTGEFSYGNPIYTTKTRFVKEQVLPAGFKRVEYLQSTGTQYINTGIYPTQLTEAEYRCAVTGSVYNADSHLFGSRLSVSSEAFDLAYMNTTPNGIEKFRFIHGTTTTQETTTSVTVSQLANPHTYYMSGTSFKVDGSEKMSFTTTSFTGTYSLWLFGVNNAGSLHNQVRAQRVYKCKIWDNGVLVRDFIPALDTTNTPCMYDTVSQTAFYNQGTGTFNYGSVLPNQTKTRLIPSWLDDYTFVNYIQSTGTQYINTGVTLTNNHSVEIDYQLTQASQSRAGLFGNLNMTGSNQGRFGSLLSPSNQQLEHGYGTGNDYWQQGVPDTNRHKLYQKKNEIYFDGTLIHTFMSATFTLNATAPLGSFGYTNYTPAKAKYYNSKWWDGDTLIRNFIPAIRKSDSAVGMLDIVNRVFYTNQGTGVFSYG